MVKKIVIMITVLFNLGLLKAQKFESFSKQNGVDLIRIGTKYGGWTIPVNLLDKNSICYCAGAGEDISFDIGLIYRYGCDVYTIDPTPRAINHVAYIKQMVSASKNAHINKNSNNAYHIQPSQLHHLIFIPNGLWKEDTIMKFYAPKTPTHVSHSILNLQKTDHYFEAPCKKVATLMKELGHDHIDLLKLDIEGAEYAVIDSILEDNLDIRCICVEFDEFAGANKQNNSDLTESALRVQQRIDALYKAGYTLIYKKDFTDMTFLKKK